jgi:hypothetical protein
MLRDRYGGFWTAPVEHWIPRDSLLDRSIAVACPCNDLPGSCPGFTGDFRGLSHSPASVAGEHILTTHPEYRGNQQSP